MEIVTDFSGLRAGLTPTETVEVFVSYCNRKNTLFAPERWFQPWREALLNHLPPALEEEHVFALRDALVEAVKIHTVISWLTGPAGMGWTVWNERRLQSLKAEQEEAKKAAILAGFFPWEHVEDCRQQTGSRRDSFPPESARSDPNKHRDRAKPCPLCGAGFESLTLVYFVSPRWTWKDLCGRAGWLTICDKCHIQVEFFCDLMN